MEKYRIYRIIQDVIVEQRYIFATILVIILTTMLGLIIVSEPVYAQACEETNSCAGDQSPDSAPPQADSEISNLECGDGGVQLGVGVGSDGDDCVGGVNEDGEDVNPIFDYLGGIVSFLSVGVGVVVTAMIMIGGIQYAAAGGNPQAVEAAKSRITNAIIALVLYAFMVGILNFLVPGGVL